MPRQSRRRRKEEQKDSENNLRHVGISYLVYQYLRKIAANNYQNRRRKNARDNFRKAHSIRRRSARRN